MTAWKPGLQNGYKVTTAIYLTLNKSVRLAALVHRCWYTQ